MEKEREREAEKKNYPKANFSNFRKGSKYSKQPPVNLGLPVRSTENKNSGEQRDKYDPSKESVMYGAYSGRKERELRW
jgi:hypothetical protein